MGGLRLRALDPPSDPLGLDYFFMGGQSNMVGPTGDALLAPTVPVGEGYEYDHPSRAFVHLEEPTGDWNVNAEGNIGAAFGIAYYQATGRIAVLHNRAIGGSAMQSEAAPGVCWDTTVDPDGAMYQLAVAEIDHAVQGATPDMDDLAAATGLEWRFGGILWDQGGKDAIEMDAGTPGVTAARYEEAFVGMIASVRSRYAAHNPDLPFFVVRLGRPSTGDTASWAAIRARQDAVVAADPHAYFGHTTAENFPAEGKHVDTYHYTQQGYNEIGTAMGQVAGAVLG